MGQVSLDNVSPARVAVGQALGMLQEDTSLPESVAAVVQNLALAVGELFEAEKSNDRKKAKGHVGKSLEWLGQTLALLQQIEAPSPQSSEATVLIADTMSRLYLASRENTRRSLVPVVTEGDRKKIEITVGTATESNFYVGFSGDVAAGGIFAATYKTLPPGTLVEALITLPSGYETHCTGFVRFVRDPLNFDAEGNPGMGIQFEDLAPHARELILRFIEKRPPMFYED